MKNMLLNNSQGKGLASDESPESQNWANLPVSYQGTKNLFQLIAYTHCMNIRTLRITYITIQ